MSKSDWSVADRLDVVKFFFLPLLFALCNGCATAERPAHAQQILFAPSVASMSHDGSWSVLVQGRVFEPADGSPARQAVIDALAPVVGASPTDPLYRERAGDLVSDSVRNVQVTVAIGDTVVRIGPSDPAGYFAGNVRLTKDQVALLARDGWITFESLPAANNPRRFQGAAELLPDGETIVVTDMDDTIKVTNVRNHAEARANTLLYPFKSVPGMPELYSLWKAAGGPRVHFHVVSAGPWQLHEPLRRFTEHEGFPMFTWDMRSVDTTDLATAIEETVKADPNRLYDFKVKKIRELMERFPNSHVVLVGDSGERDPETYATIISEFPERVDAVYVRNVTGEDKSAKRYAELFTSPRAVSKLLVFVDTGELPPSLETAR